MLNQHATVEDFFSVHRIMQPKRRIGYDQVTWRFADFSHGEFHACPSMRGTAIATDGVLLYIETQDHRALLGHLNNFIPDPIDAQSPAWQRKQLAEFGAQKMFSRKLDEKIERALAVLTC
jgi:hypothetical protein